MVTRVLLAAVFGVAATASLALPVQWTVEDGGNGHWYEYILDWNASWYDAAEDAAARSYMGAAGDLVTITSAEENAFVRQIADAQYPWGGSTNIHIGLRDTAEFGQQGTWEWAVGPEAGDSQDGGYTNWTNGQAPGIWGGDYAMMNTSGTWFDTYFDEATGGYRAPYVVEYSVAPSEDLSPAIPLPASLPLLAAALAGVTVARRRRR
ncbi:C-type lectin domain-containing protein [Tropicimonas sp. IMCC6043]|uniref:C-type lectin domain-containing protein n=1 Tax=Tropicimonas sp. IMCC6043 TaxID=2510645 RepID=UPI00101CDD89|nr:C-type lectin domain-containing protein [Tropicimonas sp. IMCC6043]RYH08301.1 C-type lectin domain-containing protein [Tropicimonas sp. IMCC6043]